MKNKEKLRQWAKTQRLSQYSELQTETILKKLKKLDIFKQSNNIMVFYPLKNELNLLPLLVEKKNFSFPVIQDNEIIPYKNNGQFYIGKYNIKEPQNSKIQNMEDLDLVIVPALCVDLNGNRIGYGKGYYDRFIKKLNRNKVKILVGIPDDLVVEKIENDEFDEKVDFIITEKRFIQI